MDKRRRKSIIKLAIIGSIISLLLPSTVIAASQKERAWFIEYSDIFGNDTPDFENHKTKEKKRMFIEYMLKKIEYIEKRILLKRHSLLNISQKYKYKYKYKNISDWDKKWLIKLASEYKVSHKNRSKKDWVNMIEKLKTKVDMIPASMIIAQSAIESAWGTSRFAKEGNNFFGQWCFKKGCGIVPSKRNSSDKHEVKKYSSVKESIQEYIFNVNTHKSYYKFRKFRAFRRFDDAFPTGYEAAEYMAKYAGIGDDYIGIIQSVIKSNKLEKYDGKQNITVGDLK